MSTQKNPFEDMMRLAQDMVKNAQPAMETFSTKGFEVMWPTMPKDVMEMTFGNGLNKEGLDAKTRLLLTLAGLIMQGAQNESQIRITVRHLKEADARDQEIIETIGHMSMFAGLPAMTRAMELAKEVIEDKEEKET